MTPRRIILFFGTAVFLTLSAAPSAAQIVERKITTTSDATTVEALEKRIEALENLVAQLRQQTAFIKSVNPLVLDASGAAVTIKGGQVLLEAGTVLDVRAGSNLSLRASSAMSMDASAAVDIRGSVVKLNGGLRPVACAGAILNGQTPPCGSSVLVPQY
jgi:hypothetical protein